MSQSPIDSITPQNSLRYRQGWSALNQLLHEGKSFSGRERNCAFINLGGQSFADVSGLIGVNYPEDARTVIAADWDFDGDLDLWLTARTAPRIRFLKNNQAPQNTEHLGIRLAGNGVTCTSDAIGAIAELYFAETPAPMLRSVTAGDAFLSQNSQWLNFSFPREHNLDRLVIHWPDRSQEIHVALQPGRFYKIKQGTDPIVWHPPRVDSIANPQPAIPMKSTKTARIVLPGRLPLPPIYTREEGSELERSIQSLRGPLLLNLWAPWCTPCVDELGEWTNSQSLIDEARLRIITLNTDPNSITSADRTLKRIKFPFESAHATTQTVHNLDWFQRSWLDHWEPLPMPRKPSSSSRERSSWGRKRTKSNCASPTFKSRPEAPWRFRKPSTS